jgi:hypothetical protein
VCQHNTVNISRGSNAWLTLAHTAKHMQQAQAGMMQQQQQHHPKHPKQPKHQNWRRRHHAASASCGVRGVLLLAAVMLLLVSAAAGGGSRNSNNIVLGADALLVWNLPGYDGLVKVLHVIASFGPQSFDVRGQLVLSYPTQLCSDADLHNTNATGNIVLVMRGGCGFNEKAVRAQYMGARALVVGNSPDHDPHDVVQMGATSLYNDTQVHIPSVFITGDAYQHLVAGVNQINGTCAASGGVDCNRLQARLNWVGNYVITPPLKLGDLFKFLVLSVVVLLTLVFLFSLGKRVYRRCQQRRRRRALNNANVLPVVSYYRELDDDSEADVDDLESGNVTVRRPSVPGSSGGSDNVQSDEYKQCRNIINDSCSICLEEFAQGAGTC